MDSILVRSEEQKELLEMFNSNTAEFLILYGRRRIGKSYLIEKFFEKKACHFFHITGVQDGTIKEQLSEFSKEIGSTFYHGAKLAPSTSWMSAFEELTKAINSLQKNKRIILFLDELPWLCTKKSRLLQALDYYWNRFWKNDKRIKLIICGSSASWIIRKIVINKGGLHNRHTRTILLKPFTLGETKFFLEKRGVKLSYDQIVQIYMFMGGIPYYLNYIKKGRSAGWLIDKLCFQEDGILYNEFDKLFDSLFEDSNIYKELIRTISVVREGIDRSTLEEKVNLVSRGGRLSERLKDLEDAAFIKSFIPLGHNRQGIYYRVIDEYCYFYLKWIEPSKKTLATQERHNEYWSSKMTSPEYHNWMGYAFESVCYKHLGEIRKALNISNGTAIGAWRYSPKNTATDVGAQIDLIFDRNDGAITLCEIKHTNKAFTIDKAYAENLMKKIKVYKKRTRTRKQIFIALISANGLNDNRYSDDLISGLVVLDDLFKS